MRVSPLHCNALRPVYNIIQFILFIKCEQIDREHVSKGCFHHCFWCIYDCSSPQNHALNMGKLHVKCAEMAREHGSMSSLEDIRSVSTDGQMSKCSYSWTSTVLIVVHCTHFSTLCLLYQFQHCKYCITLRHSFSAPSFQLNVMHSQLDQWPPCCASQSDDPHNFEKKMAQFFISFAIITDSPTKLSIPIQSKGANFKHWWN